MNTNKPIKGLIRFSFNSASGNLLIGAIACFALGLALLITGSNTVYPFFVASAIAFLPMFLMTGTGGNATSKWERFQISMPVRRKDVVSSLYLGIIIASIVGVPFLLLVSGLSVVLHESLLDYVASTVIENFMTFLGVPLLSGALFYPLAFTIGENKGEALVIVCSFGAIGFVIFASWLGGMANLTGNTISVLIIAISAISFAVSYAITNTIYAKKDF